MALRRSPGLWFGSINVFDLDIIDLFNNVVIHQVYSERADLYIEVRSMRAVNSHLT